MKKNEQTINPPPEIITTPEANSVTHTKLSGALVFLVLASFAVAGVLYSEENKPLDPHGSGTSKTTGSKPLAFLMKTTAKALPSYIIQDDKTQKYQDLIAFSIKAGNEPVQIESIGLQITKNPGSSQVDTPKDPTCGLTSFTLIRDGEKPYTSTWYSSTDDYTVANSPYAKFIIESYNALEIAPKTVQKFKIVINNIPAGPWTNLSPNASATALHGCTIVPQIQPQDIVVKGLNSGEQQNLTGSPVVGGAVTVLAGAPKITDGLDIYTKPINNAKVVAKIDIKNLAVATSTLTLKNLPLRLTTKNAPPATTLKIYGKDLNSPIASANFGVKSWAKQKDGSFLAVFNNEKTTADTTIEPMASTTFSVTLDTSQMSGELCAKIDASKLEWYLGNNSGAVRKGIAPLPAPAQAPCLKLEAPKVILQPIIKEVTLSLTGNKTYQTKLSKVQGNLNYNNTFSVKKFPANADVKIQVKADNITADTKFGYYFSYDPNLGSAWDYDNSKSDINTKILPETKWTNESSFAFKPEKSDFIVYVMVKNDDLIYQAYNNIPVDDISYIKAYPTSSIVPTASSTPWFAVTPINSFMQGGDIQIGDLSVKNQQITSGGANIVALKNLPLILTLNSKPTTDIMLRIWQTYDGGDIPKQILEKSLQAKKWITAHGGGSASIEVADLFKEPLIIEQSQDPAKDWVKLKITLDTTNMKSGDSLCLTYQTNIVKWSNPFYDYSAKYAYTFTGVDPKYAPSVDGNGKPSPTCGIIVGGTATPSEPTSDTSTTTPESAP